MQSTYLLLLSLALAACTSPPSDSPLSPEAGRTEIMETDRAFAAATADRGLEGWMAYMAPDAVRLPRLGAPVVRGSEAIRKADSGLFADPGVLLTWAPGDGGLFDDRRHGFTTGRYRVLRTQPDGSEQLLGQGAYLTWWRRDPDGRWLVILDTGTPDPPQTDAP